MKKKQIIISIFISILFFSSCEEISVHTIVNKDGSFTRMIYITGDSSEVLKSELPYPVDGTWDREFKKDTTENEEYILTYSKSFQNSDLLNDEINQDTGWRNNLNRNIKVEKKLGFFYSYPVYKETIEAANPFTILDYKKHISKEDILWITGKKLALNSNDSTKIEDAEKKAEVYIEKSFTEELIIALKNSIEHLDNPAINSNLVESYRDSIALRIHDWEFETTLEFIDLLAEWTGDNDVLKLKDINTVPYERLDKTIDLLEDVFSMQPYKVYVEMPGMITETNSLSTNGNQLHWNINASSILFEDFTMVAKSRVVNKWMFIIAVLVLFSSIILSYTFFSKK